MKVVLQRVREAALHIDGEQRAATGRGLVLLAGFAPDDDAVRIGRMAERLLGYRVFEDASGKMNLCIRDVGGDLLVVPNFTLYANTRSGRRPSFSTAAQPSVAAPLFSEFVRQLATSGLNVQSGVFGADMQVSLCNDGPVTLILED